MKVLGLGDNVVDKYVNLAHTFSNRDNRGAKPCIN